MSTSLADSIPSSIPNPSQIPPFDSSSHIVFNEIDSKTINSQGADQESKQNSKSENNFSTLQAIQAQSGESNAKMLSSRSEDSALNGDMTKMKEPGSKMKNSSFDEHSESHQSSDKPNDESKDSTTSEVSIGEVKMNNAEILAPGSEFGKIDSNFSSNNDSNNDVKEDLKELMTDANNHSVTPNEPAKTPSAATTSPSASLAELSSARDPNSESNPHQIHTDSIHPIESLTPTLTSNEGEKSSTDNSNANELSSQSPNAINQSPSPTDTSTQGLSRSNPLGLPRSDYVPPLPGTGMDLTNVFIKYLPTELTNTGLFALFSPFGEITSCKVMVDPITGYSLGYGFVRFSTSEEADRAIQAMFGATVGNKVLLCKLSHGVPHNNATPSDNLYIKPLLDSTTESDLLKLFSPYGMVLECKVMMDKTTGQSRQIGFVRFATIDEATKALAANNGLYLTPDAPPMVVKYAESRHQKIQRRAKLQANQAAAESRRNQQIVKQLHSSPHLHLSQHQDPNAEDEDDDELMMMMDAEGEADEGPTPPFIHESQSFSHHQNHSSKHHHSKYHHNHDDPSGYYSKQQYHAPNSGNVANSASSHKHNSHHYLPHNHHHQPHMNHQIVGAVPYVVKDKFGNISFADQNDSSFPKQDEASPSDDSNTMSTNINSDESSLNESELPSTGTVKSNTNSAKSSLPPGSSQRNRNNFNSYHNGNRSLDAPRRGTGRQGGGNFGYNNSNAHFQPSSATSFHPSSAASAAEYHPSNLYQEGNPARPQGSKRRKGHTVNYAALNATLGGAYDFESQQKTSNNNNNTNNGEGNTDTGQQPSGGDAATTNSSSASQQQRVQLGGKFDVSDDGSHKAPSWADDPCKLFISHLPSDFDANDLKLLFEKIGPVAHCKISQDKQSHRPKCYGFVQYQQAGDAVKAVKELHGTQVNGLSINVAYDATQTFNRYKQHDGNHHYHHQHHNYYSSQQQQHYGGPIYGSGNAYQHYNPSHHPHYSNKKRGGVGGGGASRNPRYGSASPPPSSMMNHAHNPSNPNQGYVPSYYSYHPHDLAAAAQHDGYYGYPMPGYYGAAGGYGGNASGYPPPPHALDANGMFDPSLAYGGYPQHMVYHPPHVMYPPHHAASYHAQTMSNQGASLAQFPATENKSETTTTPTPPPQTSVESTSATVSGQAIEPTATTTP